MLHHSGCIMYMYPIVVLQQSHFKHGGLSLSHLHMRHVDSQPAQGAQHLAAVFVRTHYADGRARDASAAEMGNAVNAVARGIGET